MKYLIILSAIIYSVASNHLENGAYSYQYQTDQASRSEIRHPNGHVTGAYHYLDNNMFHKVKYTAEPNRNIHIVSHNTYGVIPKDVYHNSEITYRRNLNFPQESADDLIELPPVYVRHVPSPVQHEPIVPIIDVAAPLITQHHQLNEHSTPTRRSYQHHQVQVKQPQYYIAPTPSYLVPHFITEHQTQPEVAPVDIQTPKVNYQTGGLQPLLGADVPLTHDGLTYEVARARDQHFAAIAAVKAALPPLHL